MDLGALLSSFRGFGNEINCFKQNTGSKRFADAASCKSEGPDLSSEDRMDWVEFGARSVIEMLPPLKDMMQVMH